MLIHGFGLGNHEDSRAAEGRQDVLEANMLISVRPGIYVPVLGGFRHSDTVPVTKEGYECLTHYPVDIEALTLQAWKPFTRLRGLLVRKAVGI